MSNADLPTMSAEFNFLLTTSCVFFQTSYLYIITFIMILSIPEEFYTSCLIYFQHNQVLDFLLDFNMGEQR